MSRACHAAGPHTTTTRSISARRTAQTRDTSRRHRRPHTKQARFANVEPCPHGLVSEGILSQEEPEFRRAAAARGEPAFSGPGKRVYPRVHAQRSDGARPFGFAAHNNEEPAPTTMRANDQKWGEGNERALLLRRRRYNDDEQGRPRLHPCYALVKTPPRRRGDQRSRVCRRRTTQMSLIKAYLRLSHKMSRRQTKRICNQHHNSLLI